MKTSWLGRLAAPVLAAFMLLGSNCSDDFSADADLDGYAPPGGGMQDMQFARELITLRGAAEHRRWG